MEKFTKKKALEILPAVVDNEASDAEREAFFEFISTNKEVREQYKDALLVKQIIAKRLKKVEAPAHLKNKILKSLSEKKEEDHRLQDENSSQKLQDNSTDEDIPVAQIFGKASRYITAAAVILFLSIVTIQLLEKTGPHAPENIYVVEDMAQEHFNTISAEAAALDFIPYSIEEAERYLEEHHGLEITIPELEGAFFDGLLMSDFIQGFETPILGYSQPEIDETIYIFAFDVDQIDTHQQLMRNKEAVKSCVYEHDFHVSEISDKHVVSWLWDDKWYAAISNHNGYDLASIIIPLEYSP